MQRSVSITVNAVLVGFALAGFAIADARHHCQIRERLFASVATNSYVAVRQAAQAQIDSNASVDATVIVPDRTVRPGDPNAVTSIEGASALIVAAQTDKPEAVRALLDAGADISQTYRQQTPLSYAVATCDKALVLFLIQRGAPVNSFSRDEESPLYTAITTKQLDMIRLLLSAGADVCSINSVKAVPFHYLRHSDSAPLRALARQLESHPGGVWCHFDAPAR